MKTEPATLFNRLTPVAWGDVTAMTPIARASHFAIPQEDDTATVRAAMPLFRCWIPTQFR